MCHGIAGHSDRPDFSETVSRETVGVRAFCSISVRTRTFQHLSPLEQKAWSDWYLEHRPMVLTALDSNRCNISRHRGAQNVNPIVTGRLPAAPQLIRSRCQHHRWHVLVMYGHGDTTSVPSRRRAGGVEAR